MPDGANPWPTGVAMELAQKLFPELKVVEIEDEPEYDGVLFIEIRPGRSGQVRDKNCKYAKKRKQAKYF